MIMSTRRTQGLDRIAASTKMTVPIIGAIKAKGMNIIDRSRIVISPEAKFMILPADAFAIDF